MAEGSPVGNTFEIGPVMVQVHKPRERLVSFRHGGSNPIYPYIEGLWILKGEESPKRVIHYSRFPMRFVNPKTKVLDGAYGPRVVGNIVSQAIERQYSVPFVNQLDICYRRLKKDPNSRRAVLNIYNGIYDQIDESLDIPCTMTYQFLQRNGELHMIASMRSNDLLKGYPNDVTEFQWIQEIMAGWLEVDVGTYTHLVGSLHVYEKDFKIVKELLKYDRDYKLYEHVEVQDARVTRKIWDRILAKLDLYETLSRTNPEQILNFLKRFKSYDSTFYNNLTKAIVAYNLNKAGYLEEGYRLVEGGTTDLMFLLRDKWKDVVE